MKKLTKRVQAKGLWFDVPLNTNYISFDADGAAFAWRNRPVPDDILWSENEDGDVFNQIGLVFLEGADWRECCWYVGNQVDGEVVERREWMARGVDLLSKNESDAASYFGSGSGDFHQEAHSRHYSNHIIAKRFAEKIRAGEIE